MTVVHVVRHGEVYNPDRILYGRLPGFRLSDRGVEPERNRRTAIGDAADWSGMTAEADPVRP